ncbi:MAG TPA: beta-ketoacyl-ACP synthase III [Candidatus Limnocylindria bacterium]|nr:beta-ketoacyl-ACP synthase III [Candidatus Limnocylindria bacterium]
MNLLGIGSAVPERVVTNLELEGMLDTSDEWIQSRTGIRERRVLGSETLTSLAVRAAREALADAGLEAGDIGLILVATTLGDYLFPSLACLVQKELGASCAAMDLHAACSGFVYALQTADAFITSGKARHVLIVGAEAITRLADWKDRATCVLFGDGAGAAVAGPGDGLLSVTMTSQGDDQVLVSLSPAGNCPFNEEIPGKRDGLTMRGQDVYRFAVGRSAQDLDAVAQAAGIPLKDMDWVLIHQANMRIIDAVRQRLGLDPARMPCNIQRTGNTSAASIPILLREMHRAGLLQKGQLIAMSAFGAGLTSAACVLRWDREAPQDPVPAEDLFPLAPKANPDNI